MLNDWMYQAVRLRSQSGMCWTTGISATSSGGSSSAAGIRKTPVVWYDLLPGVRTTKSWASATLAPRMTNVTQLPLEGLSSASSGRLTPTATAATASR